jgi:hypothetical protein
VSHSVGGGYIVAPFTETCVAKESHSVGPGYIVALVKQTCVPKVSHSEGAEYIVAPVTQTYREFSVSLARGARRGETSKHVCVDW